MSLLSITSHKLKMLLCKPNYCELSEQWYDDKGSLANNVKLSLWKRTRPNSFDSCS